MKSYEKQREAEIYKVSDTKGRVYNGLAYCINSKFYKYKSS